MADKTYIVKITAQAEEQLQEIIKYIASELRVPKAALRLLDEIERAISSLSQFPQRIALTEEEPWRNSGIHKLPVKNFLIYFWIDEGNDKVQVTAVIYGQRDQIKQLSQMDME
ncbi:MAG TPA: type II toxin-antitoxin system RelE/ParE family toxin [Methylomusa anaerophila]|uniref:Plasmid stabilisation system protein n=1 Tax=Methylomusa anaerophila TaxID=1930071 RepID=A0A348AKZ6_9FIRM|nr:type II toxin-antitoxin system RelE/ParE family toxin [Methylomusa anaerophila]BBB91744.1 plasmid stabilisation system protein [Methylomusa anaerophila]HML88519.1 type II toxin-antitoxin system RelE/ParE family toxin [Methylomusa anaerophila]